ncbi:DUF2169 family type VI secretion system accessory protein [Vreelandella sp. TE19]
MANVTNPTPFPHALFRKLGPGDLEYDVLTVRATYRFTGDGWPLFQTPQQRPIRWQTELAGDPTNPFTQWITDDRDVLFGKLGTEVHVHGTLRSPTSQPRTGWKVGLKVGPLLKELFVYGPRDFQWRLLGGWHLTDPDLVSELPLDYRYAFGGHFISPLDDEMTRPVDKTLYHPENPVGRGWLPSRSDYKRLPRALVRPLKEQLDTVTHLPAPQLVAPGSLITSPFDRPAPMGYGPIAPWWAPRVGYQGTLDEAWRTQRYPYWPEDFDYRFHHSAPEDLVTQDYLRGDEPVVLTNCLPNSTEIIENDRFRFLHRTRLPGIALQALTEHASGERGLTPLELDTVSIYLDEQELALTWRVLFPLEDPLRKVRIRRTSLAPQRGGAYVG